MDDYDLGLEYWKQLSPVYGPVRAIGNAIRKKPNILAEWVF